MPTADRYESDRHPGIDMGELSLTDEATAAAVHRIGRRAYAVEAELIRFDRIPPLRESLEEMRARPLRWLGAMAGGEITAFVAWQDVAEDLIDIERVCVDPEWFRRGLASALLQHLLADLAPEHDALVSTGADNDPAVALYERLGFSRVDTIEPVPGLRLARFRLARPSGRPGQHC
ncbi:GNAT family N-acetyltransferase [Streptomyces sp. NPDC059918]|uniref:GNAT family N-acetyltransferase n=1 Tax=unclassified Streptomyces TaxID=2593676 RepID=UPI0036512EF8